MAESVQEMQVAMKALLDTGDGGDLTLVCRGKIWKVHSSYLWPRSSWFKAACEGGFKESETRRIELPEEEPSMIHRMLQHLYMQAYTVGFGFDAFWSVNDSWATTRLHVHAQMYGLGDKYHLPALKKEALRRFDLDVRIPTDSKSETLTLLSVVPTIYSTTPETDRQLRNLVVRQVFQRYHIASKYFVEELDTALEVRQFARDLIVLHSKRPTVDNPALTKAYVIWHRCVRTLLAVVTQSQTAASFMVRWVFRFFDSSVVRFFTLISAYLLLLGLYFVCKAQLERLEHVQRLERFAIRHGLDTHDW